MEEAAAGVTLAPVIAAAFGSASSPNTTMQARRSTARASASLTGGFFGAAAGGAGGAAHRFFNGCRCSMPRFEAPMRSSSQETPLSARFSFRLSRRAFSSLRLMASESITSNTVVGISRRRPPCGCSVRR